MACKTVVLPDPLSPMRQVSRRGSSPGSVARGMSSDFSPLKFSIRTCLSFMIGYSHNRFGSGSVNELRMNPESAGAW